MGLSWSQQEEERVRNGRPGLLRFDLGIFGSTLQQADANGGKIGGCMVYAKTLIKPPM